MCFYRNRFGLVLFLLIIGLSSSCLSEVNPLDEEETRLLEAVEKAYSPAQTWFLKAIREKGLFQYSYNPTFDRYSDKNNAIRQLMGARLLAELAKEDAQRIEAHKRNLEFYMEYWYKEKEGTNEAYVLYNKKSKLGANSMLLRTLVISPFYKKYKSEARKLANGIVSLMDENGGFEPFYQEPNYDYKKDYLLTFYSGEGIVGLLEYAEKSGDQDILNAAVKAQRFYINRYVNEMEENYYPAYVPWHSISLNKLYKLTKDDSYAEAVFALNDKLLEIQDTIKHVGRFYNPDTPEYGKPHASSDGVYAEGMAYAYEIARLKGDKKREVIYLRSLNRAMHNLEVLQYSKEDTRKFKNPQRAIGGYRISITRPDIRIDSVQHIMDAFRKILAILKADNSNE